MNIKTDKNYYEILGVTPDSEFVEVKTAYRKLARKYHPDINKAPDSIKKFKDIQEAYETLSDNQKRKNYNMVNGYYTTPKNKRTEKQESVPRSEPPKSKQSSFDENKDLSEKKQTSDSNAHYRQKFFRESIGSILDDIVKNHDFKKRKPKTKNGTDIYTDISVTLEESIHGTERLLNIMHKEVCPNCKGRKFINGTKCACCNGTGEYSLHKRITVKIPSGIKNNTKLRLQNEGNPGFYGGSDGNLYITVKIEKDSSIQVNGSDLLCRIPISPYEAVLGGKISVPVMNGNVKLTIPPNTHSGQKFRLANQGIKSNGKFGDMIVTVEIQIPKALTPDEVKMYEKLKKMSQNSVRDKDKNE